MKNVRMSIMYNSIYALVGGIAIDVAAPLFDAEGTFITTALKIGGVMGLTYYGMTISKFTRIFENTKLGIENVYPIEIGRVKRENSTTYKFTLPTGLSTNEIRNKQDAIEEWLGKEVLIEHIGRGLFIIEVYHHALEEKYNYDNTIEVDGEVAFPVGYDIHGRLITCCLSTGDDNTHLMIGSTSGGGKSMLLRLIITFLITKKKIILYLVDLKGTELSIFEKCACVKQVCYEPTEVIDMLQEVTKIMKERNVIFRKHKVRDIQSYNKLKNVEKMKHIVIAIDEFSELMEDDESQRELERLSSLSRAAGINIIISTQRPDSKVISSRIKSNFNVIAGLRTNTAINSRIIMDDDSLASLRGRGHCIFRHSTKNTELQTMFIKDCEVEKFIKPFEIKKVKVHKEAVKDDQSMEIENFDFLRELVR